MPEVIAAIMANARRLLKDAKLLAENQRYQSAVSLSVLSLEESGKACLVRWKRQGLIERDISADLRFGHIHKQRMLGAYLFTKAVLEEVFFDRDGNAVEPDDLDATVERAAKAGFETSAKMIFYAESGALDFVKMAGFYIDLNDQMEVISRGNEITEADAARHIRDAEIAIEMAAAPTRLHRGMAAVYDKGPHWRPPRKTREVHEFVWKALAGPDEGVS